MGNRSLFFCCIRATRSWTGTIRSTAKQRHNTNSRESMKSSAYKLKISFWFHLLHSTQAQSPNRSNKNSAKSISISNYNLPTKKINNTHNTHNIRNTHLLSSSSRWKYNNLNNTLATILNGLKYLMNLLWHKFIRTTRRLTAKRKNSY